MASFDGVVIGAGHNGLALASYLSRAGLRLAVLERNARIGGGCSTDEPTLPGYCFNLHSNFFMGFRHSPLIRDLDLHRFGFAYIEPPVQQGAAFRDGTCVVIHKDLEKTCASLARFSKRDAETFRALHHLYSEQMRPLFTSLAFNAPLPIDALKDRLSGPQAKEFLSHAQHDLFSVVRKHFDDDRIRTLFTSYMHVITTESVPGAGIVFPLIFANVMEFTLPVGGAASFTDAMRRLIESCGGSVQTGADVKEIVVRNGRASAVRLANGDTVEGKKFVVSAIDAPATMRMAGEERFPEEVRKKLNSWHWGNHSLVTLHLALKEAPVYRAQSFDPDLAQAYNIFFGMDDIDQVRSCFDDCAAEKLPSVLMGNGACNSAFDRTYAPADGHSAFWWPFAPYAVDGDPRQWDRGKGRVHRARARGVAGLRVQSRRRQHPGEVLVHAARRGAAQRQHGARRGAHGRLYPVAARDQPAAPALIGHADSDRGALSLRLLDRQRRRHQRRARLHRGQRDRRRPPARAAVDAGAGAGMAALKRRIGQPTARWTRTLFDPYPRAASPAIRHAARYVTTRRDRHPLWPAARPSGLARRTSAS